MEKKSLENIASELANISKKKESEKLTLSKIGVDDTEVKKIIDNANNGDLDAMCNIGICYLFGKLVDQDYALAKKIFEHLVSKKYPRAFYVLGNMHEYGYDFPINDKTAYEYYEQGANLLDPDCLYKTGLNYAIGKTVAPDFKKALNYLQKGEDLQDSRCIYQIGIMYEIGMGLAQNTKTAIRYYTKAHELGNDEATCALASKYIEGIDIDKNIAKAIDLLEGPASRNDGEALGLLGSIYATDDEILNTEKAIYYLKKASDNKNETASHLLAVIYRDGIGVDANMLISRKYYKLASEQGSISASVELNFFKRDSNGQWYFDEDEYNDRVEKALKAQEESERSESIAQNNATNSAKPTSTQTQKQENNIEQNQNIQENKVESNNDKPLSNPEIKQTTEKSPTKEEKTPEPTYRNLYDAETISLDDFKVSPEFDELIKPTDVNDNK